MARGKGRRKQEQQKSISNPRSRPGIEYVTPVSCKTPKHYGWDICTNWEQFGIEKVLGPMYPFFEYQDKCIEHQDAEVPIVSYYTEAVGDIFREVSKWAKPFHPDREYINRKINRLRDLKDWNKMDEKDKQYFITEEKKAILREFNKKVDKFLDLARVNSLHPLLPQCKGYEHIRTVQEKSVWMLKDLIKWGLDEKTIDELQSDVWNYIREIESLLNE